MTGAPGWVAAAMCWGFAVLILVGPRRRRLPGPAGADPPRRKGVRIPDPVRLARPAALLAGAAIAAAGRPVAGALSGAVLWWVLPAAAARLESTADALRREELAEQLPLAAGILSACLAAGAPLGAALAIAADAMPDPSGPILRGAGRTVLLGGGPDELADVLSAPAEPGWQALGAAVVRSSATGAPLSALLHAQAEDAVRAWAGAASVRARGAAVRAVLPLALCYLPAFLLLGVAPLIAGLLGGVALP